MEKLQLMVDNMPELKFFARRFTLSDARDLLDRIRIMKRPSEINQSLKDFYEERVSDLIS